MVVVSFMMNENVIIIQKVSMELVQNHCTVSASVMQYHITGPNLHLPQSNDVSHPFDSDFLSL